MIRRDYVDILRVDGCDALVHELEAEHRLHVRERGCGGGGQHAARVVVHDDVDSLGAVEHACLRAVLPSVVELASGGVAFLIIQVVEQRQVVAGLDGARQRARQVAVLSIGTDVRWLQVAAEHGVLRCVIHIDLLRRCKGAGARRAVERHGACLSIAHRGGDAHLVGLHSGGLLLTDDVIVVGASGEACGECHCYRQCTQYVYSLLHCLHRFYHSWG